MKSIDNEEKSSNLNVIKLRVFGFFQSEDSWYTEDRRERFLFSSFESELRNITEQPNSVYDIYLTWA